MKTKTPVSELMTRRYSCRSYNGRNIEPERLEKLEQFLNSDPGTPFGSRPRFTVFAATEKDNEALSGLGTYGFIRGATAFISGATQKSTYDLEDYGYAMEKNILFATDLGIHTCWLGGSFSKSVFSEKSDLREEETIPAVAAAGFAAKRKRFFDVAARMSMSASKRKPFETLFFSKDFSTPLSKEKAGGYSGPLNMVRLAPSATNRQPWRVVADIDNGLFHFYLQRTKKYYERNKKYFKLADLQRVDMGIAMCHFDLATTGAGLSGSWEVAEPEIGTLPESTEYIATKNLSRIGS